MAKKVPTKKTLVEQILDKHKIAYKPLVFNPFEDTLPKEVSQDQVFKTLALIGNRTGPIIGILPITEHLSEKKLAQISDNKKVRMVAQKDLQKTTGYVHGANNPIGIRQNHSFPIIIDRLALDLGEIIVSSGEIGRSIQIDSQKLADFVGAQFADIRISKIAD